MAVSTLMDTVAGIHRAAHSRIMTIDPSICRPELEASLRNRPADSILVIGEGTEHVFDRYRRHRPKVRLTTVSALDVGSRIGELERHDIALVANTFEHLPKAQAGVLISRLRDLCSERLYVLLPNGEHWEGHRSSWTIVDMLAYGLSAAGRYTVAGKPVRLYRHDLYDYKQTPDWLNAKNWANPELWDKFRW